MFPLNANIFLNKKSKTKVVRAVQNIIIIIIEVQLNDLFAPKTQFAINYRYIRVFVYAGEVRFEIHVRV